MTTGDVTEGDTITEEIPPVETITKLSESSIIGGGSESVGDGLITVVDENACPVVVSACSRLLETLAVEVEEDVTVFELLDSEFELVDDKLVVVFGDIELEVLLVEVVTTVELEDDKFVLATLVAEVAEDVTTLELGDDEPAVTFGDIDEVLT